tara:strand:+ start:120 stop:830 length:711 start_codon:yes stop_codon:yes gene_type:complete
MKGKLLKKIIPSRILEFLWSRINSIYYSGDQSICGMCGWAGYFVNNYCPSCKSLPRSRLLHYSLKNFKKNKNILHVGPSKNEVMFVKANLKPSIYHTVDFVSNRLINLIQDITKNGLQKNYYDLVIIWHVLEHIKEDNLAISNLYSSLNDSGILIASVPIYPEGNLETIEDVDALKKDYDKLYGHSDHCRACGYDYKERFINAGFKEVIDIDANKISEREKNKYGLANHIAWISKK